MYNSNIPPGLLLGVPVGEGTGATPRTPEIVNSLIAMTDPFKLLRAGAGAGQGGSGPRQPNSPPSSHSDSMANASPSPPSVQHTKTQLIKEGLKLTLQSKRKRSIPNLEDSNQMQACLVQPERSSRSRTVSEDLSQDSQDFPGCGLTPQDEERRRMRRERNKIAATKCRLKKRQRSENLIHESEVLESQNSELKMQIHALESEKLGLVTFLNDHRPCVKMTMESRVSLSQSSYHQQKTYSKLSSVEHSRLTAAEPSLSPCSFNGYTTPPVANPSVPVPVATTSSYSHKFVGSYKSSTYNQTSTSSTEASYHHRQQDDRYCRTADASSSVSSYMSKDIVSSASPMLPTSTSYYTKMETTDYMRPSNGYLHTRSDSPLSNGYTRPSSISLTTSSSDYESNTELLDSPLLQLPPNYHFDKETPSVGLYPGGFSASSCIT